VSYRGIAAGCAVTLLVTGTFEADAAPESNTKSQPQATAAVQQPAAASTGAPMPGHPAPAAKPATKAPGAPPKKVDLNNATIEELKTLPTVGDAEAKKIIAHRPYKSKGELVTKAQLPEGVYLAVKYKVELQTPRKAAAKN
jgi:competence protein ComEA